jgi:hypothetical protein
MTNLPVAEMASCVMAKVTMLPAGACRRKHLLAFSSATVGEFASQFVRQTGDLDGKARAMRYRNVGERKQLTPAAPGRQTSKCIGADEQNQ